MGAAAATMGDETWRATAVRAAASGAAPASSGPARGVASAGAASPASAATTAAAAPSTRSNRRGGGCGGTWGLVRERGGGVGAGDGRSSMR